MIKVVHLTAHLGGGVGRALSGVAESANENFEHSFVCLEKPEKSQFVELIEQKGCEVFQMPDQHRLLSILRNADIVQVEWWNHPVLLGCLARLPELKMRLVIWCHVSGLHTPVIPESLLTLAHRFVFTSIASLQAEAVRKQYDIVKSKLAVIPSCGGFKEFPEPASISALTTQALSAGYVGSMNFAKLHPDFIAYLSAVSLPDFRVRMVGDTTNQALLQMQCDRQGKSKLLGFDGYHKDVATTLGSINTLIYLLNPFHYGTTENALLEAMAMGIVPIVMNNPVESRIVQNGVTGLVVDNQTEFADAVLWLSEHPKARAEMAHAAAYHVRKAYSSETLQAAFTGLYQDVMDIGKAQINFENVFGKTPAEWFLSCQKQPELFGCDGQISLTGMASDYGLFELSKGSVRHFRGVFSEDNQIKQWAKKLDSMT
jgi:glycosyltransferase involved in cell wall biosynthesis